MPLEEKAKFVSLWPRGFPALPPAWRLTCPLLASPLPLPLEGSPPDHKGLMPVPLLSPTGLGSFPRDVPPADFEHAVHGADRH